MSPLTNARPSAVATAAPSPALTKPQSALDSDANKTVSAARSDTSTLPPTEDLHVCDDGDAEEVISPDNAPAPSPGPTEANSDPSSRPTETASANFISHESIENPCNEPQVPEEPPAAGAAPPHRKRPRSEKTQPLPRRSNRPSDNVYKSCVQEFLAAKADVEEAGRRHRSGPAQPSPAITKTAKAAAKLISSNKVVKLAPNVYAEAAAWPPEPESAYRFSLHSEWGGVEVPHVTPYHIAKMTAYGLPDTPGLQEVVTGEVGAAVPVLISRSLIDNKAKGLGLIAVEDIEKGTLVLQHVGQYKTDKEERKDAAGSGPGMHAFFMPLTCAWEGSATTLAQKKTFCGTWSPEYPDWQLLSCDVLDCRRRGGAARFLNHSCNSNLFSAILAVPNGPTALYVYAERKIFAGEELTIDYAQGRGGGQQKQKKKKKKKRGIKCLCGSVNCRGTLS